MCAEISVLVGKEAFEAKGLWSERGYDENLTSNILFVNIYLLTRPGKFPPRHFRQGNRAAAKEMRSFPCDITPGQSAAILVGVRIIPVA
jgi:hypothetical protein